MRTIIRIFLCYNTRMIFIICGPTGSGKTNAAKALSDFYNAPIINADAFQIYKGMDIGTAKIEKSDPYYSRHYLLDVKEPSESFSVMEYQELFRKTVDELLLGNKNIIVCGGTGLYIRASIYDYVFDKQEEIDTSDLESLDNDALYELLLKIDPKSAEGLHKNNRKRVMRAIAISRSGKLKSENIDLQNHKLIYDNLKILMINPNREELYENINNRVDEMFEKGLVDEVKGLLKQYNLSTTAKAAIGYKEVIDYLDGKLSLEECKELIKKRTRNYAKRQVTFFKNQFETFQYPSAELLIKENTK